MEVDEPSRRGDRHRAVNTLTRQHLNTVVTVVDIEALLLTGGASRRMGTDKASMKVRGEAMGLRTARVLTEAGYPVTVLGREAIEGFGFQPDQATFEGPLNALAAYRPWAEAIFVAGCDMPLFDPLVVKVLAKTLDGAHEYDVAVPVLDGVRQPTCALYRGTAWDMLPQLLAENKRSLMAWLDGLRVREVFELEITEAGLAANTLRGVNNHGELERLLGS